MSDLVDDLAGIFMNLAWMVAKLVSWGVDMFSRLIFFMLNPAFWTNISRIMNRLSHTTKLKILIYVYIGIIVVYYILKWIF
jgi:hypothetical protein